MKWIKLAKDGIKWQDKFAFAFLPFLYLLFGHNNLMNMAATLP
jgi:hypothetical protein